MPVPTATAAEKVGNIIVDGRLDEEGWSKATPITEFTQVDPDEGKPATQRMDVRFLFDNEALYVGARMYEKNGGRTSSRGSCVATPTWNPTSSKW